MKLSWHVAGLKGRDGKRLAALTQAPSSLGQASPAQVVLVGRRDELRIILNKILRLRQLTGKEEGPFNGRKLRRSTTKDDPLGSSYRFDALVGNWSLLEEPGSGNASPTGRHMGKPRSQMILKLPSLESKCNAGFRVGARSHSFAQVSTTEEAQQPVPGVVLILGQAGIGKSSLVSMVRAQLDVQAEVQVLSVSGNSGFMAQQVLGPWVRLVLSKLDFPPELSPEQRGDVVVKHLPAFLHNQAYVLNDALKVIIPHSVTPKGTSRAGFPPSEPPSYATTPQVPIGHSVSPGHPLSAGLPAPNGHSNEVPDAPSPTGEDVGGDQRGRNKRRFSRKFNRKQNRKGSSFIESDMQYLRPSPIKNRSASISEQGRPGVESSPMTPGIPSNLPGSVLEQGEDENSRSSSNGSPVDGFRRGKRFMTSGAVPFYDHTESEHTVNASVGSTPDARGEGPTLQRRTSRFLTAGAVPSPGPKDARSQGIAQLNREVSEQNVESVLLLALRFST
jgi:hypothetical protein